MTRLLLLLTILCPIHRAFAMSGNPATNPTSQAVTPAPAAPKTPFAALINEYLRRDANGHSPLPEEIAAMESLQPQPDPASIAEAMPYLVKGLANPDVPLRTFALSAIVGLETAPPPEKSSSPLTLGDPTAPPPVAVAAVNPSAFKPEVAKALAPYIPQIAAHLTSEDAQPNRLLTANILGAFTPDPPAAVYPPLLAYLKRDDAISPVGLAVVSALIQLGPISDATAAAISSYLRRSDQTGDSRADLADLIATHPNQSQSLNKTLLQYLDSDDNGLRARVILSLPQLDLAPDIFADTKSRIEQLAANPNENLQVVTAAKSVIPCWTSTKMASGCPAY
jgi:hypothetical protein